MRRRYWLAERRRERTGNPAIPGIEGNYNAIAPPPQVDRFPTVLGSNLTILHISQAMRSATMGLRQQWVDVLDELLEREPAGFAMLSQRVLMVAGARVVVTPAQTEKGSPDEAEALQNAELVETALANLPGRTHAFAELLWALYYGIVGQEMMFEPTPRGILPVALQFIHSRRLAYPDQTAWDLHIWDQGSVSLDIPGYYPSERLFGLKVHDYPHKFIIHVPHVRGGYPTRDGLGRELAFWMALKGMAARGAGQYIERFAKPWAFAYYRTGMPGEQYGRAATGEQGGAGDGQSDIEKADAALKALGTGSLSGAVLPDSVKVMLEQVTGGMSHKDFIALINSEISKAVLTTSDTAEAGANGSRAAVQTRKEGLLEVARYDAANFGDTLRRDFATAVIRINRPHAAHLIPRIDISVENKPDAKWLAEVMEIAVRSHMPVDADKMGADLGLPLVENKTMDADGKPIARMLYPAKPVESPSFDADLVVPKQTTADPAKPDSGAPANDDGDPANDADEGDAET